ncbi:hypothetical protein B0J14DRAFT_548302 [Halenospora varia]|nr:hypothetical protein B0J14DRAFT_548302 [Halenospora varia]
MVDELRPSFSDVQRVYTQSSQKWSSHARDSSLQNGFPPNYFSLRNMIGNIPSYLSHNSSEGQEQNGEPAFDLHTKTLSNGLSTIYVNGHSSWNVGEGHCDLREKIMPHQLLLGVQKSISCSFSDNGVFASWSGFHGHDMTPSEDGNCIAILVFAWSYILSALWVEIQQASDRGSAQPKDRIIYLQHRAGWVDDTSESPSDTIDIHLGDVSEGAARWWAAILAKDEGWRAEIERNEIVYRSPWSTTSASADQQFRLKQTNTSPSSFESCSSPPSSAIALDYLADFCYIHNAGSQCSAALAAVLTLPSAAKANLPLPRLCSPCLGTPSESPNTSSSKSFSFSPPGRADEKEEILRDFSLLPYYMTLSCSRRGIESLLCNTFFNPHIACNLVSAWAQPIFEVLDPLIAERDYKVLATVLGRERPKIATLWTGALITGMAQSILQHCRNGLIAIEIHTAAWTNTTQTFMSTDPQPLPDPDHIYRSDESRLLYLAGEELNSRLPICPWFPFGTTALCDTDICVRAHAHCVGGHYLRYAGWSWALKNGGSIKGARFCKSTILELGQEPITVAESMSEMATRGIFGWLRSYGWPASEKAIYTHSWILSEGSDEDSDHDPEDDVSDPGKVKYSDEKMERIAAWLEQCVQEIGGN